MTNSTSTDNIQQLATRIRARQRRLYTVGFLVIASVIGSAFYLRYQQRQNMQAQREMFQAVYYFEQEEFDKALNGDGVFAGLLDIIASYPATQAANLAHFYVGIMYMHQKDYDKVLYHLSKFKSKDRLIQARAWALLGDAHVGQKQYTTAANFYLKAANRQSTKSLTPPYLAKAAMAYEEAGELQDALMCYQRIVQEFPQAEQYSEAVKHVSRLEVLKEQQVQKAQ